ncbi:MAG: hypothetical protein ACI4KL_04795 [Lentihominibacter sp.]
MRKNRLLAAALVLMMTGVMAFAFTGCGENEAPAEETTQTTEETTSESLLEDPEYDINVILTNAGLQEALDASGADYSIITTSSTVCDVAINTGSEELDGVAGTFMAFSADSSEYQDFPDYRVCGEKDGVVYVLLSPTDVRYDVNDPQQQEDYGKITEVLNAFVIE